MRNVIAGLLCGTLILGSGVTVRAEDAAREAGLSFCAAGANLVYFPAKLVVATLGLVAGGINGLLTLGDTRAAYGVWVPTASGTFVLRPSHLEGTQPIKFFGDEYVDRPSMVSSENDGSRLYDATYMNR
jgi:hypothetical protein